MFVIPVIDLRGRRCVRLREGNFAKETAYDIEPAELLWCRYHAWVPAGCMLWTLTGRRMA